MVKYKLLILALFIPLFAFTQSVKPKVSTCFYHDITPPLRDRKPIPPQVKDHHNVKENNGKNSSATPGYNHEKIKSLPKFSNSLNKTDDSQARLKRTTEKEELNTSWSISNSMNVFDGIEADDYTGAFQPVPDSNGDVGPNHYFQTTNDAFEIFDKTGTSIYGFASLETIFDGIPGAKIDPIVLYDGQADRWLVTCFVKPNLILIAVSVDGDPTGSWHRYLYSFENANITDYPKYGIWGDSYLLTFIDIGAVSAIAFDRNAMLAGEDDVSYVQGLIPGQPQTPITTLDGILPADTDGSFAPAGTPGYLVYFYDDAWPDDTYETDGLMIWEYTVDWTDPDNSSLEFSLFLQTNPFNSQFNSETVIPQKDVQINLTVLSSALMNRLQYRNFGVYQSMVCNHTVNSGGEAAIRWYELRNKNDGQGWKIHQQGTYSSSAGNAWMGSIAMNSMGDIALGYSASGEFVHPSIRYTGRKRDNDNDGDEDDDTLGEMTQEETEIFAGTISQTGHSRWGDYTSMNVEGTSFWYTNQYVKSAPDKWATKIACFSLGVDCVEAITLPDTTIPMTGLVFENASSTITNSDNYTISGNSSNGGSVHFTAGDWIELNPGFFAQGGSTFEANIEDCSIQFQYNPPQMQLSHEDTNLPERWADSSYEKKLVVNPNPSSGLIKFMLTNIEEGENYTLSIFNLSGQLIHQAEYGFLVHSYDMTMYPSGIYIIQANYNGKKWSEKIQLSK